MGQKFI